MKRMLSWEIAGTEVDRRHGVLNPRMSWTGVLRASLIVPMTFAVWSTLYRIPYGSTPRWRRHWGGSHGSDVSALCRSGRAQGDGGCVRAHRGGRRRVALSSDVRNDHGEPDRVGRVAGSEWLHACGDGSDWGLLEAGVAGAGGQ